MNNKYWRRRRSIRKHRTNGRKLWPNRRHRPYHGCQHLLRCLPHPCRSHSPRHRLRPCIRLRKLQSLPLDHSQSALRRRAVSENMLLTLTLSSQIHGHGNSRRTRNTVVSRPPMKLLSRNLVLMLKAKLRPRLQLYLRPTHISRLPRLIIIPITPTITTIIPNYRTLAIIRTPTVASSIITHSMIHMTTGTSHPIQNITVIRPQKR